MISTAFFNEQNVFQYNLRLVENKKYFYILYIAITVGNALKYKKYNHA